MTGRNATSNIKTIGIDDQSTIVTNRHPLDRHDPTGTIDLDLGHRGDKRVAARNQR
jgi:hypothetical protein